MRQDVYVHRQQLFGHSTRVPGMGRTVGRWLNICCQERALAVHLVADAQRLPAAGTKQASGRTRSMPAKAPKRSWTHARTISSRADAWLKDSLVGNLDALVALALIVMLLLGSLALTGFLTVRIGQSVSLSQVKVRKAL